jgi:hypothetical protein
VFNLTTFKSIEDGFTNSITSQNGLKRLIDLQLKVVVGLPAEASAYTD